MISFSRLSAARTTLFSAPVRLLNIHEYQGKELLAKYGVSIQRGGVAHSPKEAGAVAGKLTGELVVKAQIHAGGRGKGHFLNGFKGGVHLCHGAKAAEDLAGKMIGQTLVTKQTGAEGRVVKSVLVLEAINFNQELYFAVLNDRAMGGPVLVASPRGGVDIEAVAETNPELIFKEPVDVMKGVKREQVLRLASKMEVSQALVPKLADEMEKLFTLFMKTDATQVEINPLAITEDGRVISVDAKINFDDNASERQKDIWAYRDLAEEDPREVEATRHNLNYIGLHGNIGCLVNGAGLAMATMDVINQAGGTPANFLDVGGGATESAVKEAFKIITQDKAVKAVLVNIFGGIMKCDTIAKGIIAATNDLGLKLPLVVRLAGTNVELGKKLLKESGLAIETADDLDDAAKKVVARATARK